MSMCKERKRGWKGRGRAGIPAALALLFGLLAAQSGAASLGAYRHLAEEGDWTAAFAEALGDIEDGAALRLPPGEYAVAEPIRIEKAVAFLFEPGARLANDGGDLFHLVGGSRLAFEGVNGQGELAAAGDVLSVETLHEGENPAISFRRMSMSGARILEGYGRGEKGDISCLEIVDSDLEASNRHVALRALTVGRLRVEGSRFTSEAGTSYSALMLRTPIPGGARIVGNRLENIAVRALWLHASGGELPTVHIEGNSIVGGGMRTGTASYVNGIMVQGAAAVVIRGNTVLDFNRGEPVPGMEAGHRIPLGDGEYLTDRHYAGSRVAGAAIYVSARNGVISENVLVNSGWRAVIEVKGSGGVEGIVVSNNRIDGRALALDGSIGLETQGHGFWTGNHISNMPRRAMKLQYRFPNTVTNNVFANARQGIKGIRDGDFSSALLAHNRFLNVDEPVAGYAAESAEHAAKQHDFAVLTVFRREDLPQPGPAYRGRLAVVRHDEADQLLLCVKEDGEYRWREVSR